VFVVIMIMMTTTTTIIVVGVSYDFGASATANLLRARRTGPFQKRIWTASAMSIESTDVLEVRTHKWHRTHEQGKAAEHGVRPVVR
jgi:hypothetical protein